MAAQKGPKRTGTRSGAKVQEVLVTILGSGPAVATFESILAANQANGLMYAHAVQQQQMTNILGMAVTAKTVHYMLEPNHDARETAQRAGCKKR